MDFTTALGYTPLAIAMVEVLLQHGANINDAECEGGGPPTVDTKSDRIATAQLLLQQGADPNWSEMPGVRPLSAAIRSGNIEGCRLLLDHGADIHVAELQGMAPLALAANHGHHEMVQFLLQHGADPNWRGSDDANLVQNLWMRAIDVHWQGVTSMPSPLAVAAEGGHLQIVQLLLEHGAYPNGGQGDSGTPLELAFKGGYFEITQLLLDHGADAGAYHRSLAPLTISDLAAYQDELMVKQKETAMAYRRLRKLFLNEHRWFHISSQQNSASGSFLDIGARLGNYRQMWRTGIQALRQILANNLPDTLEQAVSFLHIVSAMQRFIDGTEVIGSKDAFLDDLDRWRLIVPEQELSLYDEIVLAVWGKEPTSHLADDSIHTDEDLLKYFQTLASSLISQTDLTHLCESKQGHELYRLRTVYSAYEVPYNPSFHYPRNQQAEETVSCPDSPFPIQQDHRFVEMHGERSIANRNTPVSHLVIFLMAGAIFGIVIKFLLSKPYAVSF